MDPCAVATGVILFTPAPGWQWNGWDGKAKFNCRDQSMWIDVKPIGVDSDLEQMFMSLLGKQYTAPPYTSIPGTIVSASIQIDRSTLSPVLTIAGGQVVTAKTVGRFTIQVTPAYLIANGAYPDSITSKQGKVEIQDCAQAFTSC